MIIIMQSYLGPASRFISIDPDGRARNKVCSDLGLDRAWIY